MLCEDAHKMHAAADAGGDENVWQTCATVAQAAVLVRAATGCRTICTGRCKTDGKLKPTRESHCVVGLHGVRHVLCMAQQMHSAVGSGNENVKSM